MTFLQKIFITVMIFFSCIGGVFANENNSKTEQKPDTEIQKTINNYILEIYKLQGNKIVAELDTNLNKVAPTKKAKIDAYTNIQETLKSKKQATEEDTKMGKNSKTILIKYLDYIIGEIENKKSELQ